MNRRFMAAKKLFSILTVVFFISAGLFAQEESENSTGKKVTLTVEQTVEYALKNSRSLKSNDIDLGIKERASKYGWNVLLPTVQASATMSRSTKTDSTWDSMVSGVGQGASFAAGTFIPQSAWETLAEKVDLKNNESLHWAAVGTIGVSWNFSLAYIQQIRASKAEYEAGKITWDQSNKETIMNIKKLFYGLLLQQESLNVQKISLENSRQRAVQAETNYKNGAIPELSLLNTQVAYQNMVPEVETAEQTLNQQLDTFAFLLGMPVGTEIELSGSIEPTYISVTSDELLRKYSNESLDIKSMQANIDVMKMNLSALNLSSYTPALSLSYNYQPSLAPYALDFDKWSKSDNWKDGGALSLTLAWNLTNMLPFSSNRQKAQDLKDNIAKLELSMETLKENQKVQVRKAVDILNQAHEQIVAMERNIALAQRSYDMSARSYRNGMTELLDLRDAETQLNKAKLGQLNQKYNYISALMDLEYTLNVNLIEQNNK